MSSSILQYGKVQKKVSGARNQKTSSSVKSADRRSVGHEEDYQEDESFVPKYIHKVVRYSREGQENLPIGKQNVYKFVKDNFTIPDDFETNHKFGAWSGVSHEERVISAYMDGKLEGKTGKESIDLDKWKMCYTCGGKCHFPRDCPEGF